MNDINLLRYHDRNACEIHRLLTGEMNDKLFSRVVFGDSTSGAGISKPALFLTLAASFACAVFASYVIYNTVFMRGSAIPKLNKNAIIDKVKEYQLELRTGGDPYLKEGYTKIATVEKAPDGSAPPVVVISEYEPPVNKEANPELFTKPVDLHGEPEKWKRDKKKELIEPMVNDSYSILFRNIDNSDVAKVKTLVKNNDLKMKVVKTHHYKTVKWNAYKGDPGSGLVMAGKHVRFVKSFRSKNEAVKYLQKKRYGGVVMSKTTRYNHYDIRVCCLGDEAAEKLSTGSGVDTNKIKIIKNNNKKR